MRFLLRFSDFWGQTRLENRENLKFAHSILQKNKENILFRSKNCANYCTNQKKAVPLQRQKKKKTSDGPETFDTQNVNKRNNN